MKNIAMALAAFCLASAGINAQTWERVIGNGNGSSFSDQLQNADASVVDNQGFIHFQSANRLVYANSPFLYHIYTLNRNNVFPWIWGLEDGRAGEGCGVFARNGNRVDCFKGPGYTPLPSDAFRLIKRVHGSQMWALDLAPTIVALDALEQTRSGETFAITRDINGQAQIVQISTFGVATTTVLGNPCVTGAYRFGAFELPNDFYQDGRLAFVCGSEREIRQFKITPTGALFAIQSIVLPPTVTSINKVLFNGQEEAFILTDRRTVFLASTQEFSFPIYQLSGPRYINEILRTSEGFAAVYVSRDPNSNDSGVLWSYSHGGIYAQATSAWVNQHDSKYAVTSTDLVIAAGTRDFSQSGNIGVAIPILETVVFSQDSKIYELPSVAMFAGKHNDENFNISVSAPENAVILSNTPDQPLGILIRQFDLAEFVSH